MGFFSPSEGVFEVVFISDGRRAVFPLGPPCVRCAGGWDGARQWVVSEVLALGLTRASMPSPRSVHPVAREARWWFQGRISCSLLPL